MSIVDINHYKVAKKYVEDSKIILKILDLAVRGLTPFSQYKPVKSVLNEISNSVTILNIHLKTADKIINGGKNNEKN